MLGFAMWTGAYFMLGLEVVRIFLQMQEQETSAAFETEQAEEAGQVRRIRACRPGHIDLTETDLRKQ